MISIFFKWLYDRLIKHNYWYKQPPAWMHTEAWGYIHKVPTTPLIINTFGDPVTKKRCKVCKVEVYSNNNRSICGSLSCWIKET